MLHKDQNAKACCLKLGKRTAGFYRIVYIARQTLRQASPGIGHRLHGTTKTVHLFVRLVGI